MLQVGVTLIVVGALNKFGTEEQKQELLGGVSRGAVLAIAMSEPEAGSDVAALKTRARLEDGEWVLNGSKVWSTGAYYADYAMCLARTDWEVPKHRGLTWFVVPTDVAGLTKLASIAGGMATIADALQ